MRVLVVGAGAVGGYFGGRLLEAGRDVTFLVRPRRARQLASSGLALKSRHGDVALASPPLASVGELTGPFDLVLLSCKAYDLEQAIESFAPAVGADTTILPLLNGLRHLELLDRRFGSARVLGGQCLISVALDSTGAVAHLNEAHVLSFGERDGALSSRVEGIVALMTGARFEARLSTEILQEMWEKWAFIAAMAGLTCLMRAPIGDIVAAGAADLALTLLDECAAIAASSGHAVRPEALNRARDAMTTAGSSLAASMLRDVERSAPTEADHILGDLLRRRRNMPGAGQSLLRIAYAQLLVYEARRSRLPPSPLPDGTSAEA